MNATGPQTIRSSQISSQTAALALVPLGILLNLAIGTIVQVLKLPVFLDAVGTIVVTLLIGIRWGITTGVLSFLIGGIIVNPAMPYFVATQAIIATVAGLFASRGGFRSVPRVVGVGIAVGVAAAVASAPVIIKLFGGITGSGSGFITAFLMASGKKIVDSVVLTGISCEPIDKTLQCLLAYWLTRTLPVRFREMLAPHGYLRINTPVSK